MLVLLFAGFPDKEILLMSIFKRNQDPPYNVRSVVIGDAPSITRPATAVQEVPAKPVSTPNATDAEPSPAADGPASGAPEARQAAAVLDDKTEITGTLRSDGNVLIEGRFHGEILARETVWIERGAQSQGQIHARDAIICGSVDGEIACEHRLQIAATAVVEGEINTPVLVIEEGATINCRFIMQTPREVN